MAGDVTAQEYLSRRVDLGEAYGVPVSVRVTSSPWRAPIDALAISAGAAGLGSLGYAVEAQFPKAAWKALDLETIVPEKPVILDLGSADKATPRRLRTVIVASVREPVQASAVTSEGPATLEAVGRATTACVRVAGEADARSLGLPLLGAGAIGLPAVTVAAVMVQSLRSALRGRQPESPPTTVLFLCRTVSDRQALEIAWGYHQILEVARREALNLPSIRARAADVGLDEERLRALVDLDDDLLLRPCAAQLNELREIDAEREALRERLIGSIERQAVDLLPEAETLADRDRQRVARYEAEIVGTLDSDTRWHELTRRRQGAAAALSRALVDHSFAPLLRRSVDEQVQQRLREQSRQERRTEYRQRLLRSPTTGLRSRASLTTLVRTEAHAELDAMLDPSRSPRLSVGVAGPRGCGKSTLLTAAYEGWNDRGIRIFVPAPASYLPREFLLHLYGRVCKETLRRDPVFRDVADNDLPRPAQIRSTSAVTLVAAPVAVLVTGVALLLTAAPSIASSVDLRFGVIGATVILAALVPLALLFLQIRTEPRTSTVGPSTSPNLDPLMDLYVGSRRRGLRRPDPRAVLASAVVGGAAALLVPLGFLVPREAAGVALIAASLGAARVRPRLWLRWLPGLRARFTTANATSSTVERHDLPGYVAIARSVGALTGLAAARWVLLAVGVVLVLGVRTIALTGWWVAGAALAAGGCATLLTGLRWRAGLNRQLEQWAGRVADPSSRDALRDLARIRYQTSVVSGWTSTLKVAGGSWSPFGLDTGVSGNTTEADVPLGVPEIVDGIKNLLPRRGPALIVIDELDKIESVDKAREFLNEIKGVLEAEQTYFVVSMSEDAIASFERRGLPFRDVFDSAFDEVIHSTYIDSEQARSLLTQREVELPPAYVALAFCVSGGLPRDLIRATDRIASLVNPDRSSLPLADVVHHVVHRDLVAKAAAVTSAIKTIMIEPDVSTMLRTFRELDRCPPDVADRDVCFLRDDWLKELDALAPILEQSSSDTEKRRELLRLSVELLGYFYYCRTLVELFQVEKDDEVDRLIGAVGQDSGRALNDLVRARQTFAINPFVAWDRLSAVRGSLKLDTYDLPAALVVGRAVRPAASTSSGRP